MNICSEHIDHPSAWKAAEIGGKEGLIHRLGKEHVEAFDALLANTRSIPQERIRADSFDCAVLHDLTLALRDAVMNGRGAIVLSGLDLRRYSVDEFGRIYWYLGVCLGTPAVQSERLEVVGYVRHEKDNPYGRGYISNMELEPHTDLHEVLSLACISKASSGGESALTSSLAVHNVMREESPEHLAPLYEGYYDGLKPNYGIFESPDKRLAVKIPVYSYCQGKVSCYMHRHYMQHAAKERGEQIPQPLADAMNYMISVAKRPELQAVFMLEPGEMVFWHNWTNFHARRAFENQPGSERILMRLWLHMSAGRLVCEEIAGRSILIDEIHQQVARTRHLHASG